MIATSILQPETPLIENGDWPDTQTSDHEAEILPNEADQHPLGLRPSGNALTSPKNAQSYMGLFGRLPDSLLLVLLEFLDQSSLINLGGTCRGLYAYSTFDQLWRDIAVNNMADHFSWRGSWRASLRCLPSPKLARVDCGYLFSDALHRPFHCSQIPMAPYISNIPSQNEITRLGHLSPSEFNRLWSGKPFILTEPVKKWHVYTKWDQSDLLAEHGETIFRAEGVDWPLKTYVEYMNNTRDESPLYLFDQNFVEKMALHVGSGGAYEPPECFQEDLFTLLKEQRPDHRWLIIGPERSGSTFHKDPNATSAWNAVIRGSKYWIMFPSSILPPGVYMSEDQSEVTSPLSIAEWLLSFHAQARNTPGCMEGVCREGEVLHVPSGWWHLVVNLDPAIAITQNFVPISRVRATVGFLRNKAIQVSGFKESITDPCGLFLERLEQAHPDLAASLNDASTKKRKWDQVVCDANEADGERQGFSFGFEDDIDADEV